jgi:hypothetical protein
MTAIAIPGRTLCQVGSADRGRGIRSHAGRGDRARAIAWHVKAIVDGAASTLHDRGYAGGRPPR